MASKSSVFDSRPILDRFSLSSVALTKSKGDVSTLRTRTRPERATRSNDASANAASKSTKLPERSTHTSEEASGQRQRRTSTVDSKSSRNINTAKSTSISEPAWMGVTREQRDNFLGVPAEGDESYDDVWYDYGTDDDNEVEQIIRSPGSVFQGSLDPKFHVHFRSQR